MVQGMASCAIGLAVIGLLAQGGDSEAEAMTGRIWMYVGAAFLAFTSGTVVTSLTSLASLAQRGEQKNKAEATVSDSTATVVATAERVEGGQEQGRLLGTFRSLGQLGRSIGPLVSCSAYWLLGSTFAYGVGALAIACLALLTAVTIPASATRLKKKAL